MRFVKNGKLLNGKHKVNVILNGNFKNGILNGKGTYYDIVDNEDIEKCSGTFKGFKLHGKGSCMYFNKKTIKRSKTIGTWKNNKLTKGKKYTF
jgi:hypothetical protein